MIEYLLDSAKFFYKNSRQIEKGFRYYYYYPIAFVKFMIYMIKQYKEMTKDETGK